jgi:hypothetical protein
VGQVRSRSALAFRFASLLRPPKPRYVTCTHVAGNSWCDLNDQVGLQGLMKLLILVLFILGPSSIGFGQLISPCDLGQNAAVLIISSGTVYFPRLTVKSSFTLRKMLEIEYGIMDKIYDNGTDISFGGEAECFFKVMKAEIEKRRGKDFYENKDE